MREVLHVDYVSDVACPWCAIGLAGLEEAIRKVAEEIDVRIVLQPFELNPGMRAEGENIDEYLGSRTGAGAHQMAAMRETVRSRAASAGLQFNQHAGSRIYNTFDAHRLLYWAALQADGRQLALKRQLFRANFTDNANVSDPAVLLNAAAAAGLDVEEARDVMTSGRHADDVRKAEQLWQQRGIGAVPAAVINGKWLVSGGQSPDAYEQALREIARTASRSELSPEA